MPTSASDQTTIVRMFPDYADFVLWLDGPVRDEDSGLSAGLIEALQAWEQSYSEALTPEFKWKSAEMARRFTAEGNRLAQAVADELGEAYEVEFDSYEEGTTAQRYRAPAGTAPNPDAVGAFGNLMQAILQEQQEFARLQAEGRIYVQGAEFPRTDLIED